MRNNLLLPLYLLLLLYLLLHLLLLALVSTAWHWLALPGIGWHCLALVGTAWHWLALVFSYGLLYIPISRSFAGTSRGTTGNVGNATQGRRGCSIVRGYTLSVKNQRFLPALPEGEPRGLDSVGYFRRGRVSRPAMEYCPIMAGRATRPLRPDERW